MDDDNVKLGPMDTGLVITMEDIKEVPRVGMVTELVVAWETWLAVEEHAEEAR